MSDFLDKKSIFILFVLFFLFILSGCSTHEGKKIRIVLITIDALRYDALMGLDDEKTTDMPLTLALAQKGMIYTKFFSSASTTQPSFATMLTDLQPWEHGVTRNGQVLDKKHVRLAEILRKHGYSTHAVVASFPLKPEMGFAQGFDEFSADFTERFAKNNKAEGQYALSDTVYTKMLGQLKHAEGNKQFFWFHFFDAHAPYGDADGKQHGMILKQPFTKAVEAGMSTSKLRAMVDKAHRLYNKDARYLDTIIKKLITYANSQSDQYETHIIFVADHGESFGEDGSIVHGNRLTPWEIHVPCFILSPKIGRGMDNNLAGGIDMTPTVLDMAGIKHNLTGGRSLLEAPKKEYAIFGMRQTFTRPFKEPRLDGTFHILYDNKYYMMSSDGGVFIGNSKSISTTGSSSSLIHQKQNIIKAKQMFTIFEEKVKGLRTVTLKDKKTLSALKTLGYAH